MPKISVIVPVYNKEQYLEKCLDSILTQTLEDIELCIIDDGSTDKSAEICDQYAEKDKRVRVLHQLNSGAGATRNKGLGMATAEYVGFVDADDYLEPDMYSVLWSEITKKNADIVLGGVVSHKRANKTIISKFRPFEEGRVLEEDVIRNRVVPLSIAPDSEGDIGQTLPCASWCFLYRRKFLSQYRINFPDCFCEDAIFRLHTYCYAKRMVMLYQPLYHYRMDIEESLSKSYHESQYERILEMLHRFEAVCSEAGLMQQVADRMPQVARHAAFFQIRTIISNLNAQDYLNKYKAVCQHLRREEVKQAFQGPVIGKIPFQQKVLYFLMKHQLGLLLCVAVRIKYRGQINL